MSRVRSPSPALNVPSAGRAFGGGFLPLSTRRAAPMPLHLKPPSDRESWNLGVCWLIAVILLPAGVSRGGDHILTIGGGSAASNNQVSLEKNVLFLQKSLAAA